MNETRYDDLLGRLLDGEASAAEADELAELVGNEPALRRDLRHHLVLWELYSQQHAPERSADAFLAGFRTRVRAEGESESFVVSLRRRLARERDEAVRTARRRWIEVPSRALLRPAGLAWAISAAVLVSAALIWLMPMGTAHARMTLHGEAVCRACILHESHEHLPAIRVRDDGGARTYLVRPNREMTSRMGDYCRAPVAVIVTGTPDEADGRLTLDVSAVEIEPAPNPPQPDERILFPF